MIDVKNLHFSYKRDCIYQGITLSWQPGNIAALLGPNGSGKTTLLRLLSGLLPTEAGSIMIGDEKPFNRSVPFLQNIFMVPEEFDLPPVKAANLPMLYGSFYPAFNWDLFLQYLREFEVPPHAKMDRLSFGQRKKAWLSFAFACQTRLLLLDEPTNALDIASKAILRQLLSAHLNPERCILISTHQVRDLEYLFDWVTIIENGKIAWHGSTEAFTGYDRAENMEDAYLNILQKTEHSTIH